jgi:hypothetical protein
MAQSDWGSPKDLLDHVAACELLQGGTARDQRGVFDFDQFSFSHLPGALVKPFPVSLIGWKRCLCAQLTTSRLTPSSHARASRAGSA